MAAIDAAFYDDKALIAYDEMMMEAMHRVQNFAPLAVQVWGDVLRELGKRQKVTLISGSYDDIGNARIARNY